MITRQQYMNANHGNSADGFRAHAEYYGQFVKPAIIDAVRTGLGTYAIRRSTDPHFNDIPLYLWDQLESHMHQLVSADSQPPCASPKRRRDSSRPETPTQNNS